MYGIKHRSWNSPWSLAVEFGFQVEFLQGDCIEILSHAHVVRFHCVNFGFIFFDVVNKCVVLFVGLGQQLVKLINVKSVLFDLLLQYVNGLLQRGDVGPNLRFRNRGWWRLARQRCTWRRLQWQFWLHRRCIKNHCSNLFAFWL